MINETVILLSRLEDCSEERLGKYISLQHNIRYDLDFYKPLQKMFSRVIPYDYYKRLTEIGYKGINEEVIELVIKERPKYVLKLSTAYEFLESTFDMIRKEGSIVIGWFFDDEFRFDNYSKWWIPHFDYCVTHDIEAIPKYKALGAQVIHTFSCQGIPINRDWANIEERCDVSFVGGISSSNPSREQYINELKKRKIPIQVVGRGGGRFVTFEEMMDIFKTSKINLNFSRAPSSTRSGFKGRITEVCLAGGFLLTEYVPAIENYFEIDKEIVCFSNKEEMVDKIIYYLNHDEERRAIAQAGWKRAINEYTPFHMVSRVFGEIEKNVAVKGNETHLQELKVPRRIRNLHSEYYLIWGRAFLEANYKGLWEDPLRLSLSYNPFHIGAWYYYIVGFSPPFMRPALFRLYKAMEKLRGGLLSWAGSIPYLRKVKRSVVRRLS